jgi:hypothetical protein
MTDRGGGLLWRWFRSAHYSLVGRFDGGTEVRAAVEPSLATVRLRLTVWDQRLL